MLALATKVVNDYGRILNDLDAGVYGQPQSALPHAKERIREAILTLCEQGDALPLEVREGLVHGFVYLAQFIPDHEAECVAEGQRHLGQDGEPTADAPRVAREAMEIIARVKRDMESALEEIRALL